MDGWNNWIERKVFVILKNKRQYSGIVIGIDETQKPLVYITIMDKFGKNIAFVNSEVLLIQEEKI